MYDYIKPEVEVYLDDGWVRFVPLDIGNTFWKMTWRVGSSEGAKLVPADLKYKIDRYLYRYLDNNSDWSVVLDWIKDCQDYSMGF